MPPPTWEKLTTEDGKTYYENTKTQETTWDCPPDFDGVAQNDDGGTEEVECEEKTYKNQTYLVNMATKLIYNQDGEEIGTWISDKLGPKLTNAASSTPPPLPAAASKKAFKGKKEAPLPLPSGSDANDDIVAPPILPPLEKKSSSKRGSKRGSKRESTKPAPPPPAPARKRVKSFDDDSSEEENDRESSVWGMSNPLNKKKKKKKAKKKKKKEDNGDHIKPSGAVTRYANFLVKKPIFCYSLSTFMMFFFGFIGFVLRADSPPDFHKAAEGFEPRGTAISGEMKAYGRHLQDAQCKGHVSTMPGSNRSHFIWASISDDDEINHKDYDGDGYIDDAYCNKYAPGALQVQAQTRRLLELEVDEEEFPPLYTASIEHVVATKPTYSSHEFSHRDLQASHDGSVLPDEDCTHDDDQIRREGAVNIVFAAANDDENVDLLNVQTLHRVCEIDKLIRGHGEFNPKMCPMQPKRVYDPEKGIEFICCKSRHLANQVTLFANKEDCSELNEIDIAEYRQFIGQCAESYHSTGELRACPTHASSDEIAMCKSENNVPAGCWRDNIAYDAFNALTDWKYSDPHNMTLSKMKLVVPVTSTDVGWLKDVHEILSPFHNEEVGGGKLVAWDTKIKFLLFTDQLSVDGSLAGVAFLCVFLLMWMQTSSFFISSLAFIEIFMALAVAYFIYMVLFWLPFFPFLNLVGIFIVIGIGADDVFVFMDAWKQADVMMVVTEEQRARWSPKKLMAKKMAWVLQRAGGAMLVTSTTTACALFATAVSNITSLRCFGIYTGLVVLTDYVLMVTYLPSVVLMHEFFIKGGVGFAEKIKTLPCFKICVQPQEKGELREAEKFFQDKIYPIVYKFRWAFVIVLGVLSTFMTVHSFGLQRPTTGDFQLFQIGHPMEDYALFWKRDFYQGGLSKEGARAFFPVRFVWGLEPVDNGNKMDPSSHGEAVWVDLNVKSWLSNFCLNLRNETWYKPIDKDTEGVELCFMDSFREWVTEPCEDTSNNVDKSEAGWEKSFPARCNGNDERCGARCCGRDFPLNQNVFNGCMIKWATVFGQDTNTGLYFDSTSLGEIKAIVFQFLTSFEFTSNYQASADFYKTITDYKNVAMKTAPSDTGLSAGFVTSELDFYDLQQSIGAGAYLSAGVSTLIAFFVLMATTKNVILTLYSCITIIFICGFSTGILVFDGWELNILESIIFSVAVGVSVDFVAHYGHAYVQAPMEARADKVKSSLTVMGVSISSASATTFIAGAVMCFSKTLFFYKFGVFLVLIMSLSWLLSTFFLTSLLAVAGPVGKWGYIWWWYKPTTEDDLLDLDGHLEDTDDHADKRIEMLRQQNSVYLKPDWK